mmetsp:Transcript_5118/g.14706  ORF Transcript_5118/g.14706 Transcript_5118/m.14706 type:complete len:241 (+) Transcript_5118:3244-3966(+)
MGGVLAAGASAAGGPGIRDAEQGWRLEGCLVSKEQSGCVPSAGGKAAGSGVVAGYTAAASGIGTAGTATGGNGVHGAAVCGGGGDGVRRRPGPGQQACAAGRPGRRTARRAAGAGAVAGEALRGRPGCQQDRPAGSRHCQCRCCGGRPGGGGGVCGMGAAGAHARGGPPPGRRLPPRHCGLPAARLRHPHHRRHAEAGAGGAGRLPSSPGRGGAGAVSGCGRGAGPGSVGVTAARRGQHR